MNLIYALKAYLLFRVGLCLFQFVSGEVAHCETSDRVIESRASNVTYLRGYKAESYWTTI